jgi:hypothetical protein
MCTATVNVMVPHDIKLLETESKLVHVGVLRLGIASSDEIT